MKLAPSGQKQNSRVHVRGICSGFDLHKCDEDLSQRTLEKKRLLEGGMAIPVLVWSRWQSPPLRAFPCWRNGPMQRASNTQRLRSQKRTSAIRPMPALKPAQALGASKLASPQRMAAREPQSALAMGCIACVGDEFGFGRTAGQTGLDDRQGG